MHVQTSACAHEWHQLWNAFVYILNTMKSSGSTANVHSNSMQPLMKAAASVSYPPSD